MFYIRIYTKFSLVLLAITAGLFLMGYRHKPTEARPKRSGVILTFDDRYVSEWITADSIFSRKYNWKATFFVAGYQKASSKQIRQLLQLQRRGNEIGFHGDAHLAALPFIRQHSLQEYLDKEFTQVEPMRTAGLRIRSFAYPNGSRNAETDSALLKQFTSLRGVTSKDSAAVNLNCFYHGSTVVEGIGMEEHYPYFSYEYLFSLLNYAKEHHTVVVLYAHRPVQKANTSRHEVSWQVIDTICNFVRKNNMAFYTMSDLAKF